MVIGNADGVAVATNAGANNNSNAHPSGIPQDKIDNIMSGIANTGDVKMNNHRKKLRQRFDIIKKLGQGTYGKVQLGINKETGQEVAIKTIKKCKIEAEADLVRIRREVQIMSSVQHPNIIHIYEVFENREKMVLVMEFAAGGELYDYLSERKVLSEIEARRIFRQVATAVYYCHKHKICHRDLKLENILLDEQGNAKIADFGLSNVFDDQRLLATFCGSPLYASPEIVEGTPYHGPEVDCWSLGVLLYTLVYGSMPFDGSNFKRLVKQISEGDYFEPKKPSRASTLIRDMLTVCPRKRATIEQICSHWWVNENDNLSCLDLAEDLANQTPVRLDVLLSLTPAAITADQLVVPSADGGVAAKGAERVPRSHSVGSIRDIGANTEAERRILDMVAAGGEAALMPSPTRTITPAQSPIQPKRKLETTQSTENASGAVKKEKAGSKSVVNEEIEAKLTEETPMETDEVKAESEHTEKSDSITFTKKDISAVADMCSKLMDESVPAKTTAGSGDVEKSGVTNEHNSIPRQRTSLGKLDSVAEAPEEKEATKVIKKFVNKHKTADLLSTINQANDKKPTEGKTTTAAVGAATTGVAPFVRKCSLQDETSLNKFNAERRKSRILETAEKFNQMNANTGTDKTKKLVIPGVSVGSFKKEFERKASTPAANQGPTAGERRAMEEVAAAAAAAKELEEAASAPSISSFVSLEDDMENKTANEIDQLCAKTENFGVNEEPLDPYEIITERERKLQNARNIIGNAIQPGSPGSDPNAVKTSSASITLKSATLPRRKTAKTEIQLEIKPRPVEKSPMRFTTEMQHPMADLRSAPARDGPMPFSPVPATNARAASLEPKEHIIPIQRPPTYTRTTSNTTTRSSGSLSRQSTGDSESDTNTTTANMSQSTVTGSSQPIKKSPREFIIPIAVEGGGIITPREGSIEPSESAQTANSSRTFNRIRPTRRIGSLLSNAGVGDEESPFPKMRTSSNNRDSEDDPRFTLHRLRSSKPMKKVSQDNDSGSSAEEDDDDDGFEILTAENLFSTLLQRVRALTNRINVNNDITSGFPNSSNRLFNNMRSGQSSFWNQDPFRSRLNNMSNNMGAPWRHSMAGRDLDTDMDSIFSRTGATLPRGTKPVKANRSISNDANKTGTPILNTQKSLPNEPMDLADLDLSRLRLSKKDLETLSNIAPGLPKCFQEQLLAKLPPTQARKLSRTLSMQNKAATSVVPLYKRSQSSGRGMEPDLTTTSEEQSNTTGGASSSRTSDESGGERNLQRRSISRSRYDYESGIPAPVDAPTNKSRSNSVSREDFNRTPYTSEVSEKYKYYSPYLSKHAAKENETVLSRKQQSDNNVVAASLRPPSGSTATADNNGSLRRRATQRRISRFLRPDFYEEPLEESAYLRERKSREREAQSVLREIREKSLERSCEPVNQNLLSPDAEAIVPQHVRNKSLELFSEDQRLAQEIAKRQRRSLSRPREIVKQVDKKELADKILQELQVLSAARNEQECLTNGYELPEEKTATIKKVKKVKSKSNAEAKLKEDTHKAVKQLKPEVENNALDTLKKESKLKRPKSYPLKDFGTTALQKTELIGYSALKPANRNSKLPISMPECEKCEQAAAAGLPAAENANTMLRESRLMRPKSYPATKLTHPQQLKNVTTVNETTAPDDKSLSLTPSGKCSGGDDSSSSDSRTTSVKKVTKVTKKSKLALPTSLASNGDIDKLHKEKSPEKKPRGLLYAIGQKFEKLRDSTKSKEKKAAVNSTTDITKISTSATCLAANKSGSSSESSSPEKIKQKTLLKKKKTVTDSLPPKAEKADHHAENKIANHTEKVSKPDKRSRLDAMWRTLRERSLPRLATPTKDASYLKRAISVEEMQGNVNRTAVSKVLGLFKRADKDAGTMRNVRSTSNIERKILDSPESPIYQNTAVMDTYTPVARHAKGHDNFCDAASCSYVESLPTTPASLTCPDCIQDEAVKQKQLNKSRHEETNHLSSNYKENMPLQTGNKDKRKGLILELNKSSDNMKFTGKNTYMNSNGIYANLPPYPISLKNSSQQSSSLHSMENTLNTKTNYANNNSSFNNNNNNNINNNSSHTTSGYHTSSTHEVNRNHLLTPSNENIANYSSDSRSYHDDCASNSTFLSPTEEAELCFDNWSVCSEDNYTRHATPSPTVSRLSRASQRSSPTRNGDTSDANESVIDRIKRRSFYCRFNDKKPKRTSSIVGPNAVRDYYREQQAAVKARSNNKLHLETHTDRAVSPDITQEFFRPLKLSPVGSELKPPIYRSPLDYSMSSSAATANRQRKSLNELRPLTTPNTVNTSSYAGRRYAGGNERSSDYLSGLSSNSASIRYKPPVYESPGVHSSSSSNYYNSYNPKRRSSYTLNGSLPNGGNHIDGYATLGRRSVRAYDQRTHSMHDTPISECSGVNNYRRDARTPVRDYSSGVLRSNSRYRATSGTRSPTNI